MSNKIVKELREIALKDSFKSMIRLVFGNAWSGHKSKDVVKYAAKAVKEESDNLDKMVEDSEKQMKEAMSANTKAKNSLGKDLIKGEKEILNLSKEINEISTTYNIQNPSVDSVSDEIAQLKEAEQPAKARIKVLENLLIKFNALEKLKAELQEVAEKLNKVNQERLELRAEKVVFEANKSVREEALNNAKANIKLDIENKVQQVISDNSKSVKTLKFVADYVIRPTSIVAKVVAKVAKRAFKAIVKFFS